MVGKDAEASSTTKNGAKLLNAVTYPDIPKLTFVAGASYGARYYGWNGGT